MAAEFAHDHIGDARSRGARLHLRSAWMPRAHGLHLATATSATSQGRKQRPSFQQRTDPLDSLDHVTAEVLKVPAHQPAAASPPAPLQQSSFYQHAPDDERDIRLPPYDERDTLRPPFRMLLFTTLVPCFLVPLLRFTSEAGHSVAEDVDNEQTKRGCNRPP